VHRRARNYSYHRRAARSKLSLNVRGHERMGCIPLLLPASLKAAKPRMIPKQSWVNRGTILPWLASGLWMVSFEPEAVTICCSFVPENCPNTADVIEEGCCIVRLYTNIELVVAILSARLEPADQSRVVTRRLKGYQCIRATIATIWIDLAVSSRLEEGGVRISS
jgi:hypothetical protein